MFFGGSPGFGGSSRQDPKRNVDATKFYKLLEIDREATQADLKKAYKKLAIQHHPDKGGDAEKFREITRAYEVLSDPEKRARYDLVGEDAIDPHDDLLNSLFPGVPGNNGRRRRSRTKDIVQPLKVTLEQIYSGKTRKMGVSRQVVDKAGGATSCSSCSGRGVQVKTVQLGPMIQQMQSDCGACGGQGRTFKTKSEREILEVHIQKGSYDGQKIVFREKADEHPEKDTGNVTFIVKEQEHPVFKRKGADLFVHRTISLQEALCGFTLELEHLDGRKLRIQSAPGDIVRPLQGFNPLADTLAEWEIIEDADCSLPSVAQAATTDIEAIKKACEIELKQKGINVGAFVIDGHRALFKEGSRDEILAAKKPCKESKSKLYLPVDQKAVNPRRIMKAVAGEGLPTFKSPFVHGNLFLILDIAFPDTLDASVQGELRKLLPSPLCETSWTEQDPSVEVHHLAEMDPVQSFMEKKDYMTVGGEAYDEDETRSSSGPGGAQCQQM